MLFYPITEEKQIEVRRKYRGTKKRYAIKLSLIFLQRRRCANKRKPVASRQG
jgi:hypothetical protein